MPSFDETSLALGGVDEGGGGGGFVSVEPEAWGRFPEIAADFVPNKSKANKTIPNAW